jgi:hypothetical protein
MIQNVESFHEAEAVMYICLRFILIQNECLKIHPARLDQPESGIIGLALKWTSTAICF